MAGPGDGGGQAALCDGICMFGHRHSTASECRAKSDDNFSILNGFGKYRKSLAVVC